MYRWRNGESFFSISRIFGGITFTRRRRRRRLCLLKIVNGVISLSSHAEDLFLIRHNDCMSARIAPLFFGEISRPLE
jgi:hypothetical protein